MITRIGITAGSILELLDKQETVELSKLFSSLDDPRDLILMSLGWLTREGHVVIEKNKKDSKISLKRQDESIQKVTRCPDFKEGKQNTCLAFHEVIMTPSIYEINNYCLSNKYNDCPWRLKSKS